MRPYQLTISIFQEPTFQVPTTTMLSLSCLCGIICLFAFPSISASPIAQSSFNRRQADCTDRTKGFDSTCWAAAPGLGLSTWLANWNATTPVCTTPAQESCCKEDELWANCFIRLGTNGLVTDDCSVINKACASEPTYAEEPVAPVIAPEVYYIIHNIYCMSAINYFVRSAC